MIGYRFLSLADEEMAEAAMFYEGRGVGLGSDFLDDVQQAIDRLRTHPEIGSNVADNLKRTLLLRFPFSLIYSVEAEEILIISVAHHRRRPGYWRSRANR